MSGADIVIHALSDQGVETLFGYPGGAVLPIYDALFGADGMRHILVRHEQGAGHAAEGYARSTGKVGVVLATSGPGATNVVTPLADALLDSVPLVVHHRPGRRRHLIGTDAFQECDTVGITRSCTKHNWLVRDVNDLAAMICTKRFMSRAAAGPARSSSTSRRTCSSRSGLTSPPEHAPRASDVRAVDRDRDREALELMAHAKRPLFYTGGGVINSGPHASAALRALARATGFPVTSTLLGLGACPRAIRIGSAWWACMARGKPTTPCTIAT